MARRDKTGKSQAGRLRIVAGNWRSRLFDIADVPGLRPTSERIRETLFNWLAPHLHGARCLDLFAGTGALGLEALSRGAATAVFVESSTKASRMLHDNVKALGARQATVLQMEAGDYLRREHPEQFDIAFLDPPFAADMLDELCRLLELQNVLADDALVYLEQDRAKPEPELPQGWQIVKNKTAGKVRYMLARREVSQELKR